MQQLFGKTPRAPGAGTVILGALNIVMDRLSRSRMAGDPPDVLISPKVGHISLLDFDRADEMVALGEDAFNSALDQVQESISALS